MVAALDVKMNGLIIKEMKKLGKSGLPISENDLALMKQIFQQCNPTNYQYWQSPYLLHVIYPRLALTLQGTPGSQDFIGQMFRRLGLGMCLIKIGRRWKRVCSTAQGLDALAAECKIWWVRGITILANLLYFSSTPPAKQHSLGNGEITFWTNHRNPFTGLKFIGVSQALLLISSPSKINRSHFSNEKRGS
jgi:hypothetical protein